MSALYAMRSRTKSDMGTRALVLWSIVAVVLELPIPVRFFIAWLLGQPHGIGVGKGIAGVMRALGWATDAVLLFAGIVGLVLVITAGNRSSPDYGRLIIWVIFGAMILRGILEGVWSAVLMW